MEDFKDIDTPEKPKKKRGCFGFFAKFSILLLLLAAAFVWWKYFYIYSNGYRTGVLQKFSYKGNIMKTYEGELILTSITSTNNMAIASEKFHFSVDKDSIANMLMGMEGKNVKLHYYQTKGALPWRGESTYLIDGVDMEEK